MHREDDSTGYGEAHNRGGYPCSRRKVLKVAPGLLLPAFLLTTQLGTGSDLTENSVMSKRLVSRIAFGSCADQKKEQPIWDAINSESPELFVFLGDNVYADTEDMTEMRAAYALLARKPGYQQLAKDCQVIAVWDDHDYGVNDGGSEYPRK